MNANTTWRDFNTDGVPASGLHKPVLAEIREWGTGIEALAGASRPVRNILALGQSNAVIQTPQAWEPSPLLSIWSNNNSAPETVTGTEEWIPQPSTWVNEINCALSEQATNDGVEIRLTTVGYGGIPISHGLWGNKLTWSTNTVNSDPGAGGIKCNNASPAAATFVYASNTDINGIDRGFEWTVLNLSPVGQPLRIRNAAGVILAQYLVTGPLTINAGWVAIPVGTFTGAGGLTNGLAVRALGTYTDLRVALEAQVPLSLASLDEQIIHELHLRWGESDTPAPTRMVEDLEELITWLETHSWFPVGTPIVVHGISGFGQTADDKFRIGNQYLESFASKRPERRRFTYPAAWPRDPNWDIAASYYHMTGLGCLRQGHAVELGRQGYGGALAFNTTNDRENGNRSVGGIIAGIELAWTTIAARPITDLVANFLDNALNVVTRSAQASTNLAAIFAQAPSAGGLMGLFSSGILSLRSGGVDNPINLQVNSVNKFQVTKDGATVPTGLKLSLIDAPLAGTDGVNKTYADNLIVSAYIAKGAWDASAGTFPGGGAAKIGWTYNVSIGGTVGGVLFTAGDSVYAIANNASTTVYAANWAKIEEGDITSAEIVSALAANALALGKIAQGSALSVVGVAGNATADHADIVAANDGEVMRRSGATVGFGTLATAAYAAASVTYAKIQNLAALSIFGNATNGATVGADITAAADFQILRRRGTALAFGDASQVLGTATNDNAPAGCIGEYIEADVAVGAMIAMTSATPLNLASISLTAGDWDVWVDARFKGGTTTVVNFLQICLSIVSATLNTGNGRNRIFPYFTGTAFAFSTVENTVDVPLGPFRMSLNATTTVYAVANSSFGTSTCNVFGKMRARRVR